VTGAQRLASLGVDVIKIMVLARWAGDTVLRYIKDAPLDNPHEEVVALEGKRNLVKMVERMADGAEALTGKVDDLVSQIAKHVTERLEQTKRSDQLLAESCAPPYVTNGASSLKKLKVHKVLIDGAEAAPNVWRARCGFRFAFCGFTRHRKLDGFPIESFCATCLKQERARTALDNSSSSSTSSSSEGE
jgi:hypothetical protein